TVPRIARQRSTSRQNIQILVDRLEADGRVELQRNPAHKRSALVCLTTQGTAWLSSHENLEKNLLRQIGLGISDLEIQQGITALSKVRSLLSASVQTADEQPERRQSPKQLNRKNSAIPKPEVLVDQEF